MPLLVLLKIKKASLSLNGTKTEVSKRKEIFVGLTTLKFRYSILLL